MNVLDEIVSKTSRGVARRRKDADYVRIVEDKLVGVRPPASFTKSNSGNTIIAEIKFSSPSSGFIESEGKLGEIVSDYVGGGASVISVLTEPHYFKGKLEFIEEVKKKTDLPVMRKDFIIDPFQVREAMAYGADGILLIAGVLGKSLGSFLNAVGSYGMWALVEAHTKEEVELAVSSGAEIIGVNNRSLENMKVDLNTSVTLSRFIPEDRLMVVESGIRGGGDIKYLKENCARKPDAFLVGTVLMKAEDRKKKLKELIRA